MEIGQGEELRQADIVGSIDEEQECTVCVFYELKLKGNSNSQVLKVKELERDL